jgi:hypothetical protein
MLQNHGRTSPAPLQAAPGQQHSLTTLQVLCCHHSPRQRCSCCSLVRCCCDLDGDHSRHRPRRKHLRRSRLFLVHIVWRQSCGTVVPTTHVGVPTFFLFKWSEAELQWHNAGGAKIGGNGSPTSAVERELPPPPTHTHTHTQHAVTQVARRTDLTFLENVNIQRNAIRNNYF